MTEGSVMATERGASVDPVTFEVLRGAFVAMCNEMALVVAKTAYSTPVNEGRDFASGLYDGEGKLISQGEFDLPAFVGLTHLTVPEVIRAIGRDNMEPEDIYMINDPYVASTHCNDIHFVKPIFMDGSLVAFVSTTAHWSDVGGIAPGSLICVARSHFEEGMRIPAVRIYERGELNTDVLHLLLANMRQEWERLGDFNAQVAATRAGESRFRAIVKRHGLDAVLKTMADVQDYSERLTRTAFTSLPDGTYYGEDRCDQDIFTGLPKVMRLNLTIDGDHAIIDLTESDDPAECSINCTIAATTSAVFIALLSILPPIPVNSGVLRAIEIKARPGSLAWALPPVGVSGLPATTMDSVTSCTWQALGQAIPERGIGSAYSILNAVFSGFDERPEFQSPFINYVWGFGGMGAAQTHDGTSAAAAPYGGSIQTIPAELQERRYPVLWRRHQFRQGSGGPGASRGGLGLDELVEFPFQSGTVSCIGARERFGAPGIFAGEEGGTSGLILNQGTESERNLGVLCLHEPVAAGEIMSMWAGGGGGYGDPLDRPVEKVVEDVKDEYVSIEQARTQYGVLVREIDRRTLDYAADEQATTTLRQEMRAARS